MLSVKHALRYLSVSRHFPKSPFYLSRFSAVGREQQRQRATQEGDADPEVTSDHAPAVDIAKNEEEGNSQTDYKPAKSELDNDVDVQDYLDEWFAFESSVIKVQLVSEFLKDLSLRHVSDGDLRQLPPADDQHQDGEPGEPGQDAAGPTEADLEEYLVGKLQLNGAKLIGRNWHVCPGLDNEGRGDLIFECSSSVDLVVEVKYLDLKSHGGCARARRTRKRRKVVAQAVDYAMEWHKKVSTRKSVIAAIYTNEYGLMQLAWLIGRRSLGRKVALLRCQNVFDLSYVGDNAVDRVIESLSGDGFKVVEQ